MNSELVSTDLNDELDEGSRLKWRRIVLLLAIGIAMGLIFAVGSH